MTPLTELAREALRGLQGADPEGRVVLAMLGVSFAGMAAGVPVWPAVGALVIALIGYYMLRRQEQRRVEQVHRHEMELLRLDGLRVPRRPAHRQRTGDTAGG